MTSVLPHWTFDHMNANALVRWLSRRGCTLDTFYEDSQHLTVRFNQKYSQVPIHHPKLHLPDKLVQKIQGDLGLK